MQYWNLVVVQYWNLVVAAISNFRKSSKQFGNSKKTLPGWHDFHPFDGEEQLRADGFVDPVDDTVVFRASADLAGQSLKLAVGKL